MSRNIGAELVAYVYELRKQWLPVHMYLYSKGAAILSDADYDVKYHWLESELGVVGAPFEMPPIPEIAIYKEEAKEFGVPIWEHKKEYRRLKKEVEG